MRKYRGPTCALVLSCMLASTLSGEGAQIDRATSRVAGPASHGIAVALYPDQIDYAVGQPMFVTIEFRNVTTGTLHLVFTGPGPLNKFSIVSSNGFRPAPRPFSKAALAISTRITSDGDAVEFQHSCFQRVDLNDLYDVDQPGDYTVELTSSVVGKSSAGTLNRMDVGPSNAIKLHIVRPE